jgi:hypothetical protein
MMSFAGMGNFSRRKVAANFMMQHMYFICLVFPVVCPRSYSLCTVNRCMLGRYGTCRSLLVQSAGTKHVESNHESADFSIYLSYLPLYEETKSAFRYPFNSYGIRKTSKHNASEKFSVTFFSQIIYAIPNM